MSGIEACAYVDNVPIHPRKGVVYLRFGRQREVPPLNLSQCGVPGCKAAYFSGIPFSKEKIHLKFCYKINNKGGGSTYCAIVVLAPNFQSLL